MDIYSITEYSANEAVELFVDVLVLVSKQQDQSAVRLLFDAKDKSSERSVS